MRRVAWLTSGFAPYRVPLWNALGDMVSTKVFLLAEQEKIRKWSRADADVRVPVQPLPGRHLYVPTLDWGLNISYGRVKSALDEYDPDGLVVGGYESPGFWAAANWARARDRVCVMHYGSTDLSSRSVGIRPIEAIASRFIGMMDGYYTYGQHAAARLRRLGADPRKIVVGQNLSDTALTPTADRIPSEREGLGLLYVGQIIDRKGVMEMMQALKNCTQAAWHCTIVGDGPGRNRCEEVAKLNGLEERFSFLGQRPTREIAELYRKNDILIMPSLREVWGLTTNEALLSGLFVIGSNRAASCLELLKDGINGFIVEPTVDGLTSGLRRSFEAELPSRTSIRDSVLHISPLSEATKVLHALCAAERNKSYRHNSQ